MVGVRVLKRLGLNSNTEMMKVILIVSLVLIVKGYDNVSPTPTPSPPAGVVQTLRPVLLRNPALKHRAGSFPTIAPPPTPYPTPRYDPASYLPKVIAGRTAYVSAKDGDLATLIKKAQDDPNISSVSIKGGGSITKQVVLRKHTVFDGSTYSCDVQGITDYGVFLIADGVLVEGTWRAPQVLLDFFAQGNGRNWQDRYLAAVQALAPVQLAGSGTTILEPTYTNGILPAVEVFQALGDSCCSHTDKARDVAVVGFHIKGRQKVYDGGVRSTILFGNCTHCTAQNNYLEDTASIGITFGGAALEHNNFSSDCLAWHNVTSGVAAANIAAVNSENMLVIENYAFRLGHHSPRFGGGVCGFDMETNSPADHSKNIKVFNNLYDYEGSMQESAGNAVCLQDPYVGVNHGLVVAANNLAIGGRSDNVHRYMSNGLFLNRLKGCQIINNYVFRTGQNGLQAYGLDGCLVQGNDFESTGGGGNPTVWIQGTQNTIFRRNNYRDRLGLAISTQAGFIDHCGKGNVYENNLTNGRNLKSDSQVCP
jgi:hypothetical protein